MENRLTSSGRSSQEPQHWTFSTKVQADLQGKHVTPENFSDRIIFVSMFKDIGSMSQSLTMGHWAFLGPGEESKRYEGYATDYGRK